MLDDSVLAGSVKDITSRMLQQPCDESVDPTCGNCGMPLSRHYHEDEVFCNDTTSGDVFTDDPSDTILMVYIRRKSDELYRQIVKDWKQEHGHGVE